MRDAGDNAERPKRANAPDTKQELLPNPDAIVAAVQSRRQLAILRLVAFDVRVEQQQRISPDREPPYAGSDRAAARFDRDRDDLAVSPPRQLKREQRAIDVQVILLLIAVVVEP